MAGLTLYTNPMSRGRIARWMLEEVGEPYDTVVLGYQGEMKTPDYLSVNPMGKVPALKHGDMVVTEGAAICAYLADVFPAAGLKPDGAGLAPYYRWLFFAAGPIEQAVTNKSMGWTPPADKEMMAGYGNFGRVMDVMEQAVTGRTYVAGDRFSAADVYFGSQIGWGLTFGSIDKRPEFERYWAGLAERPAYGRAADFDDEAMPQEG